MSEDKEIIQKLNMALDVSNNTIKQLEKRIADAQQMIALFEREKTQWQQQKVLQEKIIKQQLEASDNKVRELEHKIIELRQRLKAA